MELLLNILRKIIGPAITSMKFYSEKLGNHLAITGNYNTNNKKVILKQISPYRTDFYVSPEGKYKFVTVRYKDVFYKETIHKFVIDENWYNEEKVKKGIDSDWKFVCSMHRDELIGVIKKEVKNVFMMLQSMMDKHNIMMVNIMKF